tara:strand:+ start:165 stop:1448 length:1284 start_codon:yes stop_codon:yes gene_type:complete
MSNNKELREQINKLEKGIKHCAKKWEKEKERLKWYSDSEPAINVVILRNFTYVRNVVKKMNENLDHIKIQSKKENLSKEEKNEIDNKFLSAYVLLESVIKINDDYSIVEYDYEVMNLKMFENDKISKLVDPKLSKMVLKNKKDIVETFDSCKVKIVEGFGFLDPIMGIIDEIKNGFMMVIRGMVDIAKFVGNLLKDFVLLLFELLKMLYYFIVKIIPAIFTFFVTIMTGIFRRAHLIPFALFFFIVAFAGYYYYEVCMLGSCDVMTSMNVYNTKSTRMLGLVGIVTLGLWWNDNGKAILTMQKMFTEIMLWIFIGPGQFFAMLILNVPRNHRMFLKSTPSEKKAELISAHIIFNFPFIVTRLFIWVAVGRKLFEFFSPITIPYIPTLRELSLVPFVVLRDIIHITGLANIFSGEGAVVEAPVEAPIE